MEANDVLANGERNLQQNSHVWDESIILVPNSKFQILKGKLKMNTYKILTAVFTMQDFWGCPNMRYDWRSCLCSPDNEYSIKQGSNYTSKETELEICAIFKDNPVDNKIPAQLA